MSANNWLGAVSAALAASAIISAAVTWIIGRIYVAISNTARSVAHEKIVADIQPLVSEFESELKSTVTTQERLAQIYFVLSAATTLYNVISTFQDRRKS